MWELYKKFFPSLRNSPAMSALYLVALVGGVSVAFLGPYYMGRIVDGIIASVTIAAPVTPVWIALGWWVAANALGSVLIALQFYGSWTFMNREYAKIYVASLQKLFGKNISLFNQKKGGEVSSVLYQSHEALWSQNAQLYNDLLPGALGFVVILSASLWFSWQLALTILIALPIQGAILWYTYRVADAQANQARKLWTRSFGMIGDVLQNVFAVKLFARESHEVQRIGSTLHHAMELQIRTNVYWAMAKMFDIDMFVRLLLAVVGVPLMLNGSVTLGTFFMFMGFVSFLTAPVRSFVTELQNLQKNIIDWNKFKQLAAAPETIASGGGTHEQNQVRGALAMRNVTFSYDNKPVLRNVTFTIQPGEHVALVGPSGAGKSTIAQLLARFYDPKSGVVTLDGVSLSDWNYDNFRSHLAMVWQENMLFHESLAYNVKYGDLRATSAAVNTAIDRASLTEFVAAQKKGLKTVVGERGVHLSGGEKQRVMIARAVLKNANIVILDEATSALDSITERAIQQSVSSLIEGKTAVIIAHRLSTIRAVDRIFVVNKGRIEAQGTHDELLKSCTLYRSMVALQSNGLLPDAAPNKIV